MKMVDFTLEEMIRVEDLVRRQCPNITTKEHTCIGWGCTWIVREKCIFMSENPTLKTAFYNFTVPQNIRPRRKEYKEG